MNNLFLVRHAESEHHVGDLTGGWTDVSLTGVGCGQTQKLAEQFTTQLHGRRVRLYSSDLKRCRETAGPIAAALQCDALFTPALRELNNGVAAWRTKNEANSLLRPPTEPVLDWLPYEGAESWRRLHQRIVAFGEGLTVDQDVVVVIVTHANALICLVNWFLKITSDELLARTMYDAAPGSITHLRVDRHGCRTIGFLNNTSHLECDVESRWRLSN